MAILDYAEGVYLQVLNAQSLRDGDSILHGLSQGTEVNACKVAQLDCVLWSSQS
jgi:hypothetical protein